MRLSGFGAPGVSRSGAPHLQPSAAVRRALDLGLSLSISRAKTLRLWIHPAPPSGRCFNMVADGSSSTSGRSLTRRNLVAELIATRLSAARAGGIVDLVMR